MCINILVYSCIYFTLYTKEGDTVTVHFLHINVGSKEKKIVCSCQVNGADIQCSQTFNSLLQCSQEEEIKVDQVSGPQS